MSKPNLGSIPKYDDIKRVFDSEESTLQWLVKKRVLQIPVFLGKSKLQFHHSILVAYLWLAGYNLDSMYMISGCPIENIESWITLCRQTVHDDLKCDIPYVEGEDRLITAEKIWREANIDTLWDSFLMAAVRSVNRKLEIDEAAAPIDLTEEADIDGRGTKREPETFASALSRASMIVLDSNELLKTITNVSETTKKTLGAVAFRLMNGVDEIEPLASGQTMHFGFEDVYEEDEEAAKNVPQTMEEVAKTVPDIVPLVTGNDVSMYEKLRASQAGFHDVYDGDSDGLFIYNGPSYGSTEKQS
jgi:hypothetical protein